MASKPTKEEREANHKEAAIKPWQHGNRGHQGGISYKTDKVSSSQNGLSPVWASVCNFALTMEDEDFLIATHNELLERIKTLEAQLQMRIEELPSIEQSDE